MEKEGKIMSEEKKDLNKKEMTEEILHFELVKLQT